MKKRMIQQFVLKNSLILLAITPTAVAAINTPLKVIPEIKHDLLLSFAEHSKTANPANNKLTKLVSPPKDIPVQTFTGMGEALANYQVKTLNPDVNGSVGMTQYVQTVNYDIAVFDKKTGEMLTGFPKSSNAMWKGFGGQCEHEVGKYQLVKYDQLAHRWVITQTTSSSLCIAVSTTDDATGSYHRYAFDLNAWPVNARLGLWPTAYFMSFDLRNKSFYTDSLACALDRNKMLTGEAASAHCQVVPRHFYTITHVTPADLEGITLPLEDGMPNYFVGKYHEWFKDTIFYFKFYVDFNHPNNSRIGDIIEWQSTAPSLRTRVRQRDNGWLDVDNNGINLNHRVVYRVFQSSYGGLPYGSLIGCYTSDSGYTVNQHWFEYQIFFDTFYVEQQGDIYDRYGGKDRYTGSIAMDKAHHIAIANNFSSWIDHPSIELNYRKESDPINLLFRQQTLLTGSGSQNASPVNKWGTYSSLSIDPADDCTFWYTNAYIKTRGSEKWSTAIFHFKLPNCR